MFCLPFYIYKNIYIYIFLIKSWLYIFFMFPWKKKLLNKEGNININRKFPTWHFSNLIRQVFACKLNSPTPTPRSELSRSKKKSRVYYKTTPARAPPPPSNLLPPLFRPCIAATRKSITGRGWSRHYARFLFLFFPFFFFVISLLKNSGAISCCHFTFSNRPYGFDSRTPSTRQWCQLSI